MDPAYFNKSEYWRPSLPFVSSAERFLAEIVDLSDTELIALGFLGESEPFRHYTCPFLTH